MLIFPIELIIAEHTVIKIWVFLAPKILTIEKEVKKFLVLLSIISIVEVAKFANMQNSSNAANNIYQSSK